LNLLFVNQSASLRNREAVDDDILIARLADGDDAALRALFSRHAPMLATRLRAVLPAADVEDVLQETFVAAWRGARRYRSEGAVGGWLWGIARVQAALLLRRRGPAGLSLSAVDAVEWQSSADPADAVDLRTDLEAAVAALGPGTPEREVWRLRYEQDRPIAEIAALMGVPEGTVKSRAGRSRDRGDARRRRLLLLLRVVVFFDALLKEPAFGFRRGRVEGKPVFLVSLIGTT
jgi:RNA polymerase sigma-70 factor (ECF subfamily)